MWSHFAHIFWRAIHGMPLLVSSNWASWGLGLVVFVLYEALAIAVRGWQDMKDRWKQNVGLGLLATAGGYLLLFTCSAIVTTYDEHHDSTGRWQAVVREKNGLKAMLEQRDDYIGKLELRTCPTCPSKPKQGQSANEPQPRALSDLQKTVLLRDLSAGRGLPVRINAIGSQGDTISFAEELRQAFREWDHRDDENIGNAQLLGGDVGTPSELEFAIPNPQDRSVQLAIHAFDHAHITYSKNVSPSAYRGSSPEPPPLTINVRDR